MKTAERYPQIFPIGDNAITLQAGAGINSHLNQQLMALQQLIRQTGFTGLLDTIIAYNSLSLYYDPYQVRHQYQPKTTAYDWVEEWLKKVWAETMLRYNNNGIGIEPRKIQIPVCYHESLGTDLHRWDGMEARRVIDLHLSREYRVYMLGFLPGFPYMGEVDEQLFKPRKERPEQVLGGSVGIAGLQTGIYPFPCPGGWNIIGRTPVRLFDASVERPALLQVGDLVRFVAIGLDEFESLNHNP